VKYVLLFAAAEVVIGVVTTLASRAFVLPTPSANPTTEQVLNWIPRFFGALVPLLVSIAAVNILFLPIAAGGMIKLACEKIEKGHADLWTSVRFALSQLLLIWARGVIVSVFVVLGLIALIVPVIILAIMFSFALPALLIEDPESWGA